MGVYIAGCCRGAGGGEGSEHAVLKRRCRRGVEIRVGILIRFGGTALRSRFKEGSVGLSFILGFGQRD